jgi:hypothetical protein
MQNVALYKKPNIDLGESVAQHSLGAAYAEVWKVVCTRDSILTPFAISMRIAVDLVIRVETTAQAEAVQCGLNAGSGFPISI